MTRKVARFERGSYQEALASQGYGRSVSAHTALTVTAPLLSTVTMLDCQYPAMPLVRWWSARNAASSALAGGTGGWAAAYPRLAR